MAGIDRLRVKDFCDKQDLVLWCIEHKPSLLKSMIYPFESYDYWVKCKQAYCRNIGIKLIPENEERIDNIQIDIAHFLSHEDRYLYWHCPLEFVREYLETQCGYKKANWFVKLFWRK